MADESSERNYVVEFDYEDSGFSLLFEVDDWMEMVEEDFTSFEAIRNIFGQDFESTESELRESLVEVEEGEDPPEREGASITFENPPQSWIDDPANAAEVYRMLNITRARMGLYNLMEIELAAQNSLLDAGRYKAAVIRQSAFFEELLTFYSQLALQGQKEDVMSNSELKIIEQMGHRDRIRLAKLLGEISTDEHAHLQHMAQWRNRIAHTPWNDFSSQDESQIESVARHITEILQSKIEGAEETFEEPDQQDQFEMGFNELNTEIQLLQIGIATTIAELGGEADLSDIQSILLDDNDAVESRCNHMYAVGYLERAAGRYTLTEQGQEFITKYVGTDS